MDNLITAMEILFVVLWAMGLVEVYQSDFKNENRKLPWFLLVLFLPVLGSALFYGLKNKFVEKEPECCEVFFNKEIQE